jgi:hypothetical protein
MSISIGRVCQYPLVVPAGSSRLAHWRVYIDHLLLRPFGHEPLFNYLYNISYFDEHDI